MHFLIDADLPRPVRDLLRRYGHEATDVRDIGMRSSVDSTIAQYAQQGGSRSCARAWLRECSPFDSRELLRLLRDAWPKQLMNKPITEHGVKPHRSRYGLGQGSVACLTAR